MLIFQSLINCLIYQLTPQNCDYCRRGSKSTSEMIPHPTLSIWMNLPYLLTDSTQQCRGQLETKEALIAKLVSMKIKAR